MSFRARLSQRAHFILQPKWNNALQEPFRIDYIGTSPYMNCLPSFHHQKLVPKDKFLVLSFVGLYQYFTNEELVSEVEFFMSKFPEGDPSQHLVDELYSNANKSGVDFHVFLHIPPGDSLRYHDEV
ncbi:probable protein phosphatase 2C 4 [Capsicum annuum]|uniref:probable protein phosphatase 2C 4 n=1 Tax=Capsicum annuum TaxID=4072 RepID=UPI001FB064E2|nr:probable protein phosphatase 2C 4 [Capsicum annuum]